MQFCEKGHMIYSSQPCGGCEAEKKQKPKQAASLIDFRVASALEVLRASPKTNTAIREITSNLPPGLSFDTLYQNIVTGRAGFFTANMQVSLSVHKGHIVFIYPQSIVDLVEASSGLVKGAVDGVVVDIGYLLCAGCNQDKLSGGLKPERLRDPLHQEHDVAGGLLDLNSIKATGYGIDSIYGAFKRYYIPKINLNLR